jgi:hypothetical protein
MWRMSDPVAVETAEIVRRLRLNPPPAVLGVTANLYSVAADRLEELETEMRRLHADMAEKQRGVRDCDCVVCTRAALSSGHGQALHRTSRNTSGQCFTGAEQEGA